MYNYRRQNKKILFQNSYYKIAIAKSMIDDSFHFLKFIKIEEQHLKSVEQSIHRLKGLIKQINYENISTFKNIFIDQFANFMQNRIKVDQQKNSKNQKYLIICSMYYQNCNLNNFLSDTSNNGEQKRKFMIELAKLVKYFHDIQLSIRNIKMENLFYYNNKLWMTDTLLHQILEIENKNSIYQSPQICYQNSTENQWMKSDIWSLGILMLQIYLGKRCYDISSKINLYRQKSSFLKNYINATGIQVESKFKNMLAKILRTDPKKRPNINQIIEDLEDIEIKFSSAIKHPNNNLIEPWYRINLVDLMIKAYPHNENQDYLPEPKYQRIIVKGPNQIFFNYIPQQKMLRIQVSRAKSNETIILLYLQDRNLPTQITNIWSNTEQIFTHIVKLDKSEIELFSDGNLYLLSGNRLYISLLTTKYMLQKQK